MYRCLPRRCGGICSTRRKTQHLLRTLHYLSSTFAERCAGHMISLENCATMLSHTYSCLIHVKRCNSEYSVPCSDKWLSSNSEISIVVQRIGDSNATNTFCKTLYLSWDSFVSPCSVSLLNELPTRHHISDDPQVSWIFFQIILTVIFINIVQVPD